MARTPNKSPRMSRASPATVGKITKKNNNLITNLKLEGDASKSIVSSICTPRRMTRSSAKASHQEMPPPTSPLHTKKRKMNTSVKKSSSAIKQENEKNKLISKGRKSMKLFAENVATESDSDDGLPSVSILGQNKTPVVKIESHIDAELIENKPLAKHIECKSKRSSNNVTDDAESENLNATFEVETENEENKNETDLSSAGKQAAIKNRISVIDLTESPAVMKVNPLSTTSFSPLANILEESDVQLSDEKFTDEKSEPKVQTVKSDSRSKLAKKATPKSAKKDAPQLKRLQVKTPMKNISETKSQTPIGIVKPKPMPSAKKAKVLEAAKVIINESVTVKSTGSAKKILLENVSNDAKKSSPFRFGAAENKSRGFNFNLISSKIPTWKELEKQKKQEKNAKSVTKSVKKAVPNFKIIHERMFEKDLALSDVENHKSKRANFIKSNKKVTNEENIFKPANVPKSKRKLNLNNAKAKVEVQKSTVPAIAKPVPLKSSTFSNRARLNGEQREERRKMMFKQSGKRRMSTVVQQKVQIKGVRTNRRFDLMMENRFKSKN